MESFNWFSLIIAGLIPSIIGFIWHQPSVLGKVIDRARGIRYEEMQKGHKPYVYIVSLVLSFVIAFYLAYIIDHGGNEYANFGHGAFHASVAAVHMSLPLVIVNYMYEKKAFLYIFLNALYWLISITIMGGIIAAI
jgi:hypothetical protein